MPIKSCRANGKPGYKWGNQGKCYTYTAGNKASKDAAHAKAAKQGAAAHASGYRGNDMLQRITANFTGHIRRDSMAGNDYLVAPMIMLVEGVHEGSGGALLYPKEELSKTPQMWNYKPVVVYHPQENGIGVSACDPIILSNRQIGVIMNTSVSDIMVKDNDGKNVKRPALKAEAWLQEDRMKKIDERIANAVEKNEMMELSTGLFTDNESAEEGAEWNGETYEAIARNYRADHLALLPDLKGACSIEDGAGFLRLNAKRGKIHIIGNAMSHSNIRSLLNSWLRDKDDDVWVEDVYDTFFIFMKDGKYFKGNYTVVDNALEIEEVFVEVVRVSEWRTLDGGFVGNKKEQTVNVEKNNDSSKRKENKMEKEKIVDAIIACNTNSWGKDDREMLVAMEETALQKLTEGDNVAKDAVENATKKGAEGATAKLTVNQDDKEDANTDTGKADAEAGKDNSGSATDTGDADVAVKENQKPQTAEEFIAGAPKDIRPALNGMMANYKAIKTNLIKKIIDNEKNTFTKEELQEKDMPELKKLAALLPGKSEEIPDEIEIALNNFAGQADVEDVIDNKEEPMVMPAIVNAKKKK